MSTRSSRPRLVFYRTAVLIYFFAKLSSPYFWLRHFYFRRRSLHHSLFSTGSIVTNLFSTVFFRKLLRQFLFSLVLLVRLVCSRPPTCIRPMSLNTEPRYLVPFLISWGTRLWNTPFFIFERNLSVFENLAGCQFICQPVGLFLLLSFFFTCNKNPEAMLYIFMPVLFYAGCYFGWRSWRWRCSFKLSGTPWSVTGCSSKSGGVCSYRSVICLLQKILTVAVVIAAGTNGSGNKDNHVSSTVVISGLEQ